VNACLDLLAQLPTSYVYISPVKAAALAVVFALWAVFAQWVDKDTVAVNTFRVLWNLIAVGTGMLAAVLALFIPMFAIGFPLMVVINLAVFVAYVVHRNKLVRADDRVFTAGHLRRLQAEGFSGRKRKQREVKELVRLTGADRRVVLIPEDEAEREQYRLTQELLFDALWRRAAVIEVVPAGQAVKISYIVDGLPIDREGLLRPEADAMLQFVKRIAGLNLDEHRKPQKGQIMVAVGGHKQNVVVQTDGSTAGEKLTVQIVHGEAAFKIPDLGFNPKQLEQVQAAKEITHGLVLLSAPPGCGLTTTIYSFTRTHDRFLQNVQSMEFEKEMDLDNVTQRVFSTAEGKTFAEDLQKLIRTDPDIIVLPELREREAAAVASKAAAEKQRIYVGLVANDVFDALRKWIAQVGDKTLVAKSLLAISNQRLVRILCRECKQAYKPDPQMLRKLNLPADKTLFRPPEPQYDKHGNPIICQACQGTGYVGRTGVFDWLAVDDGMREVIRRSTSMADIQNYALKRGGLGLQAQALQKVLDGITSIQEVARAVRGPETPPKAGPAATPAPRPRPQPKPQSGAQPGTAAGGS